MSDTFDTSLLTDEEQILVAYVINHLGSGDHPLADQQTLPFFRTEYVVECLRKAAPPLATKAISAACDAIIAKIAPKH
jgi:hypothetical protein